MSVKVWKKNPIYHDGVHTSDPTYNTPGWDEIISGRTPNYDFDNECFDRDGDSISLSDDIKGKLDKITIDTTPVEGDVLTWDETAGAFIPEAPEGGGDAEDIAYNNATSGLAADDVQDAIDEVTEKLAKLSNITNADSTEYTNSGVAGNYYTHNGKLWKALQNSSGVTPTEGQYWTEVNVAAIKDLLGNASSASAVTGADAFSKINSLNTSLTNKLRDAIIRNELNYTITLNNIREGAVVILGRDSLRGLCVVNQFNTTGCWLINTLDGEVTATYNHSAHTLVLKREKNTIGYIFATIIN